MRTGWNRLWNLPLSYALWLALPLQLLMVWVAHHGWVHYQRNREYQFNAERSPPFVLDHWRYFTKKEFERGIDRAFAPVVPDDGIETIHLTIDRRHIGSLNSDLPQSGKTKFYPATIEIDGRSHRVKTRYVGDNHWHWLYPQKSWKIKTRSTDPIRNRRSFNLKNTPTPVLEDTIANQIAVEIGLMAPDVAPVKLFVNGAYSGVHYWQDVADESLLRRFRRMPGSIYSGDSAPYDEDGVGQIFAEPEYWEKDAARNAEQLENRADIDSLIAAVNNQDPQAFRQYVDDHLDIEQFARFTALDRMLGGQHHDYTHNHKLYFDPYKGRFEPIEWDFAWWQVTRRLDDFDHVLYPLLTRVREQPEFEYAIQRQLWAMLHEYTPDKVRKRIEEANAEMRPSLAADGFRDVRDHEAQRKLRLPQTHCAHFSMDDFDDRVQNNANGYRERHEWMLAKLEGSKLSAAMSPASSDGTALTLHSDGGVGQRVQLLRARSDAATVELVRDRNRNGRIDDGEKVIATASPRDGVVTFPLDELLLPGLKKTARPAGSRVTRGIFALGPAPLRYSYVLRPRTGQVTSIELQASNAVTGTPVAVQFVEALPPTEPNESLHPWDLPQPQEPQVVNLGPGEIAINESATVESHITMNILPGTTLRMAPGVSLEFRGRVNAVGTKEAPIRILASDESKPWGVFALHGVGTKGSRFRHCDWRNGSTSELRMVLRTGMVSIIDTADIKLSNCFIGKNHVGDDALHFGYVTGGEVRDCEFDGARSDAFDIDITEDVEIVNCVFHHSGNDALDLMTSKIVVRNCHFHDTGDKGISVGEATTLDLFDSKFERCLIGIEIKDSSVANVDSATRLLACPTGVNLYRKNTRYTNGGTIHATDLWVLDSPKPLVSDKRSTVAVERLHTTPAAN